MMYFINISRNSNKSFCKAINRNVTSHTLACLHSDNPGCRDPAPSDRGDRSSPRPHLSEFLLFSTITKLALRRYGSCPHILQNLVRKLTRLNINVSQDEKCWDTRSASMVASEERVKEGVTKTVMSELAGGRIGEGGVLHARLQGGGMIPDSRRQPVWLFLPFTITWHLFPEFSSQSATQKTWDRAGPSFEHTRIPSFWTPATGGQQGRERLPWSGSIG